MDVIAISHEFYPVKVINYFHKSLNRVTDSTLRPAKAKFARNTISTPHYCLHSVQVGSI